MKSGGATDMGLDQLTRAHVSTSILQKNYAEITVKKIRRLFGSLVDITSCAEILCEFLHMSLLTVKQEVDREWY